jgi:hypothetical protein
VPISRILLDVTDITLAFTDAVFTGTAASLITGSTKSDFVMNFTDTPVITYDVSTFTESAALDGSISTTVNFTLTGDTFASVGVQGAQVIVSNVPAGLTAVVTTTSSTAGTITLTGSATAHANANDVANLSVVWQNAAFTNTTTASNVTNYSKTNFAVDFGDAAIIYSGPGFSETVTNSGAISGSLIATLTGATFTNAGSTLTAGVDVILGNIPAGLTPVLTVNGAGTTVTLTLTGSAATHVDASDVADITFIFANSAINTVPAANVSGATGPASSAIGINFNDAPILGYTLGVFTESTANNGSIANTDTITLTGTTFVLPAGLLTAGIHYTATNVPAGLTPVVLVSGLGASATVSLTGNASPHTDAAGVSNLTIAFLDSAFTNVAATDITGSTNSTLVVDLTDPASILYAGTFAETLANGGSLVGSSRTATLTGDTFAATLTEGVHFTLTNKPAGLTAVMTRTSPTLATLTFTGAATAHANSDDRADLTITWLDGAFTNTVTAMNITGYTDNSGAIDFADQPSIIHSGSFLESPDDGTITGSRQSLLSDDTFVNTTLTEGVHFTLGNKPAGLTAVMTRTTSTVATLTFTGTASSHDNDDDIANLTITWLNGAFVNTLVASDVTNYTNNTGVIDFIETGVGTINYDVTTFTESAANNGAIGNAITLTLSGDTFAPTLVIGTDVVFGNVPAGLTAAITRVSDTVVTLALSGNASAHASANDIANLTVTFANSAFANLPAVQIGNYFKNNIVVDYADITTAALAYSATTFTESGSNDGSIVTTSVVSISGGGTFAATLTAGANVIFTNVPAGLTAAVTRNNSTTATISFTGNATSHMNADDIANFTVTFTDAAFSGVLAANVTGTPKADFAVDFSDPTGGLFLNYSTSTFSEHANNDGSIATSPSLTGDLTGDTFVASVTNGSAFTSGTHYTISGVPAGLTAVLTKTDTDTVTITFTGTATAHANSDDISNLTIIWQDAAFTTGPASFITNSSKNNFIVNFADPAGAKFLSYSTATFTEAVTNNGTVPTSVTVALSGDTFATGVTNGTTFTSGTHFTPVNVPSGLTMVITKNSSIGATVTLTGTATSHVNIDDIANMGITWLNAAFTGGSANAVSLYNKADFVVDFTQIPNLSYSATTLNENASNNGSIVTTSTGTLLGDTFTGAASRTMVAGVDYSASVPSGLTAVVQKTSATTVTITLSGNATAHANANDTTGFVTFLNGAFTGGVASSIAGAGTVFTIDYIDIPVTGTLTYASSTFTERVANDGGISNTINIALTGDTFAAGVRSTTMTSATHFTPLNVPAGLTPVITVNADGTNAVLSFTGTATAHVTDITNVTIAFLDAAFTGANAVGVTGSTKSDITIDFTAPVSPTTIAISQTRVGVEGVAPTDVEFTVSLDEPATSATTFDYVITPGTAVAGTDYTDNSTTGVAFTIGNQTQTFTVPVLNDGNLTGTQSFTVTISNVSGGLTISNTTASGTITDDENASSDNDTDSISNTDENAGYNGGDINGDGILDSLQPNVGSTTTSGETTGIEVTNACQVLGSLTTSTSETDAGYTYPE